MCMYVLWASSSGETIEGKLELYFLVFSDGESAMSFTGTGLLNFLCKKCNNFLHRHGNQNYLFFFPLNNTAIHYKTAYENKQKVIQYLIL